MDSDFRVGIETPRSFLAESRAGSQLNALTDFVRLQNRNALSYAIRTAFMLGVFEVLDSGQKNADQIATATGTDRKMMQLLLDVLINSELLEKYGDDYALSAVARLVPKQFMDFGDLYWCHLENFVRTGQPLPDNDRVPHTEADFLASAAANEWMMTPASIDAARVLDIGLTRTGLRILEIGCGSAVFGSTLIHRDLDSRLVLLDTAANLKRARKTIESIGADDRVQYEEGSYLEFKLEHQPFDLIVAAGILHRHTEAECKQIFANVRSHLKTGAEFVLVEIFPGQSEGETTRTIMALEIALRTHNGGLHDPAHIQHTLIMNGFDQIQFAHLPSPPHIWGLVLAQRD